MDQKLKNKMEDYIEKFKLEFDLAQTDDLKEELLVNILDYDDIKQHKELLNGPKYKRFLIDIQNKTRIDSDTYVNNKIEDGSYESYTCIKSVDSYLEGVEYYVNIEENKGAPIVTELDGDPLSKESIDILTKLNIDLESEMRDVSISNDPLVWIITERDSLKHEKMVVDFKFFEHFVLKSNN
jgi:hypothetical protein